MQRIETSTCTDALIEATERAGEMNHVLIIYERGEPPSHSFGIANNEQLTAERALWMMEQTKLFILGVGTNDSTR